MLDGLEDRIIEFDPPVELKTEIIIKRLENMKKLRWLNYFFIFSLFLSSVFPCSIYFF